MNQILKHALLLTLVLHVTGASAQVVARPAPQEDEREEKRTFATIFAALTTFLFGASYVAIQETKDDLPPPPEPAAPPPAPAREDRQGGDSSPRSTRRTLQGEIAVKGWQSADGCFFGFFDKTKYDVKVVIEAEIDAAGNPFDLEGFIRIDPGPDLVIQGPCTAASLDGASIDPDAALAKDFAQTGEYKGPIRLRDGTVLYPAP